MIPPCLTLSNVRYISRVKWSNPGKGVAPSLTPRCCSYWKGSPSGHPRLRLPTLLLLTLWDPNKYYHSGLICHAALQECFFKWFDFILWVGTFVRHGPSLTVQSQVCYPSPNSAYIQKQSAGVSSCHVVSLRYKYFIITKMKTQVQVHRCIIMITLSLRNGWKLTKTTKLRTLVWVNQCIIMTISQFRIVTKTTKIRILVWIYKCIIMITMVGTKSLKQTRWGY